MPDRNRWVDQLKKIHQKLNRNAGQAAAPKPERHVRRLLFQLCLGVAIIGFAVLAFYAFTVPYFPFDLWITQHFQRFQAPWFVTLMVIISWPGFPPQIWVIALLIPLILVLIGLYWEALMVALAAFSQGILNIGIKALIHRTRPDAGLVNVIKQLASFSFPSGHVMFYVVFFGFLIFLALTLLRRSLLRTSLILLLGSLVILVGPSRVFLGQHWTSDVLAGYLLGSLWLILIIQIYRWGRPRLLIHPPVASKEPRNIQPPGEDRS
jgi:undecaprenyl-diphosphatase